MNEQQLLALLDTLAARFGTTVNHLWDVLLRQVYLDAAMDFLWVVIFLTTAVLLVRKTYWAWTFRATPHEDPWGERNEVMGVVLTIVTAITVIVAVIFVVAGSYSVVALFNPEYQALRLLGRALNPAAGQ